MHINYIGIKQFFSHVFGVLRENTYCAVLKKK
jgi:hypothetical protein